MSTINDTYLQVVEQEDGLWEVVDEHGNTIIEDCTTESSAIAAMEAVKQSWHEQRKESTKTYEIQYTNICYVTVEANSEEEAYAKLEESGEPHTIEAFQDPTVI